MSNWNTSEGWSSGASGLVSGASAGSAFGPVGSIIGGLVGGIGGLFGGGSGTDWNKKYFNESVRQFNVLDDFNKNATQYRVQDALKAGINPLAALGVSSNVSPTMHAGGSGSGSNSGSTASKFVSGLAKMFARQESESNELDLEAKRIRNDIARQELNILRQPGIDSGNQIMEQPPVGTDEYLFRIVYDMNGDPRLMVNQDVTENDSDNAGYLSSLQYAYRNGGIGLNGRVTSPALQDKIASDYERATGRKLMSKERLYISPSELGLAGYGAFK